MRPLPRPGELFGEYVIDRKLGGGAMGVVYLAIHPRLFDRQVAVKLLNPALDDLSFRKRFEREAKILAQLDSPHIVGLHDFGEQDGWLYLTTPYLPGGDLEKRIKTNTFDPDVALELTAQLASGLAAVHRAGILHRDIKPLNILLAEDPDEGLRPLLADFGIAWDPDITRTSAAIGEGTLSYLPPERFEGAEATASGDVYALGCVLWALLHGHPPFEGTAAQILRQLMYSPVPTYAGPQAKRINAILQRCLAKDPGARFPDAAALRAALRAPRPVEGSPDSEDARPGSKFEILDCTPSRNYNHLVQDLDESRPHGSGQSDPIGEATPIESLPPEPATVTVPADQAATERQLRPPSRLPPPKPEDNPQEPRERRERRSMSLWIGAGVLVALVIAGVVSGVLINRDDDPSDTAQSSPSPQVGDDDGPSDTAQSSTSPQVGDCQDYSKSVADATFSAPPAAVECAELHTAETFHVGALSERTEAALEARAPTCFRELPEALRLSGDQLAASTASIRYYTPSADQWADGERWFRCDLVFNNWGTGEFQQLTGTSLPAYKSAAFDSDANPEPDFQHCIEWTDGVTTDVPCSSENALKFKGGHIFEEDMEFPGDDFLQSNYETLCDAAASDWEHTTWPSQYLWRLGRRTLACFG